MKGISGASERGSGHTGMQLFDAEGRRLYFTEDERRAFVAAAARAPREVRAFCGVLHATGCRISEALALTPRQIDLSGRVIVFESLKKRRTGVFRAVPVPPELLDTLDLVHGIRVAQRRGAASALLWPWSRVTAWPAGAGGDRSRRDPGRPARLPQGPAARLRRAGGQQGHRPQHDPEMARAMRNSPRRRSMRTPWARRNRASPQECGADRWPGYARLFNAVD